MDPECKATKFKLCGEAKAKEYFNFCRARISFSNCKEVFYDENFDCNDPEGRRGCKEIDMTGLHVTAIKSYSNAEFKKTCNRELIRPGGFKITLSDGTVHNFGDTEQKGCHAGMPVNEWKG